MERDKILGAVNKQTPVVQVVATWSVCLRNGSLLLCYLYK